MSKEQTQIEMAIENIDKAIASMRELGTMHSTLIRHMTAARNNLIHATRAMPTTDSAEPVAWKWQQLMHGHVGGWHSKCEQFNPLNNKLNKPEDIKMLTPLYTHPPKPDQPRVVLTYEQAHAMAVKEVPRYKNNKPLTRFLEPHESEAWIDGYAKGLMAAPAKPFPVDEVMEVVKNTDVLPVMNAAMAFKEDEHAVVFSDPAFPTIIARAVAKAVELARAECVKSITAKFGTP